MEMRLGIVICDGNPKWDPHLQSICDGCFKTDDDEELTYYHAWRGDIPTLENTSSLDGLICLGSAHSANDDTPWMTDLSNFFLAVEGTKLKVVALCFGHQLVNKAYGGRITNVEKGFIFGADVVRFTSVAEMPGVVKEVLSKYCSRCLELCLIECHGEEVSELPTGATLIASSARCYYEVILVRDNILTFQSHPDLTKSLMMNQIWPDVTAKGFVCHERRREVEEEMKGLDTAQCLEIIRDFISLGFVEQRSCF